MRLGNSGARGWKTVPFSTVGEIASNLVDPSDIADLPHIAPNHIPSGLPRLLPYRSIGEDGVISGKHHFSKGQILYSKIRPYLRKVVIAPFDGGCSADMYPINARHNSRYLMYWMLSPKFTELASRHDSRTVLPKINQTALNSIPTPIPETIEEEKIIADRLDAVFGYADRIEQEVKRVETLIGRLKTVALEQAFSGLLLHHVDDSRGDATN